jgi:tRNA-Thr(GGU) m(6)t(6)A37 methyltransferase TsaA
MEVCYTAIGMIHSAFKDRKSTPIQGVFSDAEGTVEIFPEYAEGLSDLEGFSHIFLIYHFHEAGPPRLRVHPFLDRQERGIFATRHHDRPNAIGISIVELVSVNKSFLRVRGVDILDGTPLLDIKPYVRQFDIRGTVRCGWIDVVYPGNAGTREDLRPDILQTASRKDEMRG